MMSSVGILKRKENIFIQPYHEAVSGVDIGAAPVKVLSSEASDVELGSAVVEALQYSRTGVPHPADWSAMPRPLWEAAGVKSQSALMKNALYCNAAEIPGAALRITPTKNGGPRRGFEFLLDQSLCVSMETPEEIGRGVVEALERSS